MLFGAATLSTVADSYLYPGAADVTASLVPQGAIVPFAATITVIEKTDGIRGVGLGTYEFVLVTIDASDVPTEQSLTTGAAAASTETTRGDGSVVVDADTKIGVIAKPSGVVATSPTNVSVTLQLHHPM